jgi:hypothetical protein
MYLIEEVMMKIQMPKDRLVSTSVRISPHERSEIERMAAKEDRSVSQIARRLIRNQLYRVVNEK